VVDRGPCEQHHDEPAVGRSRPHKDPVAADHISASIRRAWRKEHLDHRRMSGARRVRQRRRQPGTPPSDLPASISRRPRDATGHQPASAVPGTCLVSSSEPASARYEVRPPRAELRGRWRRHASLPGDCGEPPAIPAATHQARPRPDRQRMESAYESVRGMFHGTGPLSATRADVTDARPDGPGNRKTGQRLRKCFACRSCRTRIRRALSDGSVVRGTAPIGRA